MLAHGGIGPARTRSVWKSGLLLSVMALGMTAGASVASASALAPGDAAFKTDASVPNMPKYTQGLPAYFIPANVRGTLAAAITGDLHGTAITTVYENPSTGFLTFQYFFEAADDNSEAIARATIGGMWSGVGITDSGADASGHSGTGDPMPEWLDGDPLFLERDPISDAPSVQWRAFGLGAALGAGDYSSLVWFETDQRTFAEAAVAVIDTALTGSGRILAPGTVIPLPTATLLAGVGLIGVAARRRRTIA